MLQTEQILNLLIIGSFLFLLPGFWKLGSLIVRWLMARYVRTGTIVIRVTATDSLIEKLMAIDDRRAGKGSHG
jgi:hypothetical protein